MKNFFKHIALALPLYLSLASCEKAPYLTMNSQNSVSFKDNGGSDAVSFVCNRAWTVSSSESWVKVSPSSGEANEEGVKVSISCEANTTFDPRTATVSIKSEGLMETISISQDTNYGLMSDPNTFNLTNAAQTIEIDVKANVEYEVAIDAACQSWISQAGTKGLVSSKLTFNIAANETYDDREGKIKFKEENGSLYQLTLRQTLSGKPQLMTIARIG